MDDRHYLVQYEGGGYDGCFWEWNLCLIDKEDPKEATDFLDVFSSGWRGIQSIERLKEDAADDDWSHNVYDLATDEGQAEFNKEVNPGLVRGLAIWLRDNDVDLDFEVTCDDCGGAGEEPECIILTDLHGDGGIGIEAGAKVCQSCLEDRAWENWLKDSFLADMHEALEERDLDDSSLDENAAHLFYWARDESGAETYEESGGITVYGYNDMIQYLADNWKRAIQEVVNRDDQLKLC